MTAILNKLPWNFNTSTSAMNVHDIFFIWLSIVAFLGHMFVAKVFNHSTCFQVEVANWISSRHNMGMAFTVDLWNEIKNCGKVSLNQVFLNDYKFLQPMRKHVDTEESLPSLLSVCTLKCTHTHPQCSCMSTHALTKVPWTNFNFIVRTLNNSFTSKVFNSWKKCTQVLHQCQCEVAVCNFWRYCIVHKLQLLCQFQCFQIIYTVKSFEFGGWGGGHKCHLIMFITYLHGLKFMQAWIVK